MSDSQTKNIQKILQIQSSLVSGKVFGAVYPALLDLASKDRVFIKEIDLRKVCKKQNVLYHFWLFNDCLIYGLALETGKYLFHRKIELITCSVVAYRSLVYKHALEISAEERSFIVLASNGYEQTQLLNLMISAISAIRSFSVAELIQVTGLPTGGAWSPTKSSKSSLDATASPLWMSKESSRAETPKKPDENPNSGANVCVICSEVGCRIYLLTDRNVHSEVSDLSLIVNSNFPTFPQFYSPLVSSTGVMSALSADPVFAWNTPHLQYLSLISCRG